MKNLLSPDNTKIVIRILDLFCGAGGAAEGYDQALTELGIDHEIVGVDIAPQPRYPFRFVQGDALEYLAQHGHEFDFIHASPPCQAYTQLKYMFKNDPSYAERHPALIPDVRRMLIKIGVPYVIENVMGAIEELNAPIVLCGYVLGLQVYRHRAFECDPFVLAPPHLKHPEKCPSAGRGKSKRHGIISVTGTGGSPNLGMPYLDYARRAMGIDWMNRAELSEAIPPAYTRWIGMQIFSTVERVK